MISTGDLSDREGYDFEQIKSIAKVQVREYLISARDSLLREDDAITVVCDALAHGWLRSSGAKSLSGLSRRHVAVFVDLLH